MSRVAWLELGARPKINSQEKINYGISTFGGEGILGKGKKNEDSHTKTFELYYLGNG